MRRHLKSVLVVFMLVLSLNSIVHAGGDPITHTVRYGETLIRIAMQYGVDYEEIAVANGIANANLIYPGDELIIPGVVIEEPIVSYQVMYGDTLGQIAHFFGTSVRQILLANSDIPSANLVYAGQVIDVPGAVEGGVPAIASVPYTVIYGDTLGRLAVRFDTTVETLALLNTLPNPNLIFAGQVIQVPDDV